MKTLLFILALLAIEARACTLVVMGVNKGAAPGSWRRGQIVDILPDRADMGKEVRAPLFYLVRLPGVPVAAARKWLIENRDKDGELVRRREWRLRVADMPAAALTAFQQNGQIVVRVAAHWDKQSDFTSWDFTWAQVQNFMRNDRTETDGDAVP